jgi:predicted SprT family Zn-dependent metalloprotease
MNLDTAYDTARQLMDLHGLHKWDLRFDHARNRCGACHFSRRELSISKHFVRLNDMDEVRQTVLHEIAHALAGPRTGHNRQWRRIAARIGAPTTATNTTAAMPPPAWLLQCGTCLQVVASRHRRSLNLHHVRCGHCGASDHTQGQLQWIKREKA